MKKYKALAEGYANGIIYKPGQVFEFDGKAGSWMEEIKKAKKPEKPSEKVKK